MILVTSGAFVSSLPVTDRRRVSEDISDFYMSDMLVAKRLVSLYIYNSDISDFDKAINPAVQGSSHITGRESIAYDMTLSATGILPT